MKNPDPPPPVPLDDLPPKYVDIEHEFVTQEEMNTEEDFTKPEVTVMSSDKPRYNAVDLNDIQVK